MIFQCSDGIQFQFDYNYVVYLDNIIFYHVVNPILSDDKKIQYSQKNYGFYIDDILRIGKKTSPNGWICEGEFDDNGRLKKGKKTSPDGWINEGKFDENDRLKEGKKTLPDGCIEKGEFDENGRLKEGKRTSPNGWIEEGEFHENSKLKEGKQTSPDGWINEGEFNKFGTKHGYCLVRHPEKQSKDGYYLNGKLFNHKHKKWKKQDDEILNTYFKKPIHDIQKIYKLTEKLG